MAPLTLVTALYDIGRGSMRRSKANCNYRPFQEYLKWFSYLLRALDDIPLVVFIPPSGRESDGVDLYAYISSLRREAKKTTIITLPFSSLPFYQRRERIGEVMRQLNTPYTNLEFNTPDYIIIIYSKFYFLEEATKLVKSKYYLWVDAGYFRHPPKHPVALLNSNPSSIGDRLLIQNYNYTERKMDREEEILYYSSCPNEILACIFGGKKKVVRRSKERIDELFTSMLELGLVNNEQQALAILISRCSTDYTLYPYGRHGRHLLEDMSKGELKIIHPSHPNLLVLTVATQEISNKAIEGWVNSCYFFGYHNQILGRDDRWSGWQYRTQKYLAAVEACQRDKVVILCDSTDLFFTGPSTEAYEKFISKKVDVVLGGENIIAYSQGNYYSYAIEEYFIRRCSSRFCFPNGGFVMGYAHALIELLSSNLSMKDDQAGYMDLSQLPKLQYSIDETTSLIANIPNYHSYGKRDNDFWEWDVRKRRYYNPLSHEYPIALHFPGNNRKLQETMYGAIFGLPLAEPKLNYYWLLLMGGVVFVLFLVIIHTLHLE